MKKTVLLFGLFVLLAATGCTKHEKTPARPVVKGIQVEVVKKEPIESFYETSADVKSKAVSVVSSMVMGKVTSIAVQDGDFVKAGQLLLTIDNRDMQYKAMGASKAVEMAKQNMQMAQKTYDRYKMLYDEQVITRQEFDQFTTQKNVAQLDYERALAGLGEVNVYRGYARVTAPVSGLVTKRNIDLGSTAIQGQPLVTIETKGDMELAANVDESYIKQLKAGQEVLIDVDGVESQRKITAVVPSIDPMTRTFKVKIDVQGLTGGQYIKIKIPVATVDGIAVNKDAIVEKGQLQGVYAVDENNIISYRLIRTGKSFGDKVEVLSGLDDGDKIIVSEVEKAVDGGKLSE